MFYYFLNKLGGTPNVLDKDIILIVQVEFVPIENRKIGSGFERFLNVFLSKFVSASGF